VAATAYSVRGHITLVQEERFRVVSDSGQGLLFTLAHNANISAADLHRFHEEGAEVVVGFRGEPDLETGVAHSVRAAGGG
jgi:hypothetical protein